jgi:hypothetical protein
MVVEVSSHTDWVVLIRDSFPAIPTAVKTSFTCEVYEFGSVSSRKVDPNDASMMFEDAT